MSLSLTITFLSKLVKGALKKKYARDHIGWMRISSELGTFSRHQIRYWLPQKGLVESNPIDRRFGMEHVTLVWEMRTNSADLRAHSPGKRAVIAVFAESYASPAW